MRFLLIVFFLVGTFSFGQRSDFVKLDFNSADSVALKYKGASLENLPVLVFNLTADLQTDVEKFRSIYTWVCTNIENDYSSYQKTVKKRKKLFENQKALDEWNDNFTPKVFENLRKRKKTSCTGYAFLIREMAALADINCKIVNGYGRTPTLLLDEESIPNHSWNVIELNNKWYLCDPTWSAGKILLTDEGPKFEADYFDGYFLANPELFIKNHFPIETKFALVDEPPSFEDFTNGPVIYKEAFQIEISAIAPSKMYLEAVKNEEIQFTISTSNTIDQSLFSLGLNSSTAKVQPRVTRTKDDFTLKYAFTKSGSYDVHLKIDESIIATYVVKVKRK